MLLSLPHVLFIYYFFFPLALNSACLPPGHGIGESGLKLVPTGKEFPNLCLCDAPNDPQSGAQHSAARAGEEKGAGGSRCVVPDI